ncbi:MAG: hypothetical protein QOJ99_2042 [Bryobacterales bacterium]|jgi:hypothetical protein|nr:hypothetical protein [Bryobacterales bacterium]
MKAIIDYEPFPPEKRLEDHSQTAEGWKFETLEHDEMTFPPVIRATDAQGRSCLYVAFGPEGGAIDIKKVEIEQP